MSAPYKRLINEYLKIHTHKLVNVNFKDLVYKIYILSHEHFLYKTVIQFNYKNKPHNVSIIYDKYYPIKPPVSIKINNKKIINLYYEIINKNKDILSNYMYKESILYTKNWNLNTTIKDILIEIKKIIDYYTLYSNRLFLNSVINKYCPNEDLDYLYYYLL